MTKTDLAELKDKLCEFDEIEIHEQFNNYDKECDFEGSEVDFTEGAINENAKSAAIISELIEIIQSQGEALEEITGQHSELCQTMKPVRPGYACHAEIAQQALSETNTRLQKLRDGK